MGLLITPTLLNSFDFMQNCPPSWKESAYDGLYKTLWRIYDPEMPKPVKLGIEFENHVYNSIRKCQFGVGSEQFQKCCNYVRGGTFQRKSKKDVVIDGKAYTLYGKLDVYFPTKIIDIKTTGSWKGPSKYTDGWQHIFYTYTEDIRDFEYYVVVWGDKDYEIKESHIVKYHTDDMLMHENKIKEHIKKFITFLENDEKLKEGYFNKFNLY